jgi:hypothetical protein
MRLQEFSSTPVNEADITRSIMNIDDLTISDGGMAIATNAGGDSVSNEPLTVTQLPSGHVYLVNGYHRLVDAIKAGKSKVEVEFVPYKQVEILWKNERKKDIQYGKKFSKIDTENREITSETGRRFPNLGVENEIQ